MLRRASLLACRWAQQRSRPFVLAAETPLLLLLPAPLLPLLPLLLLRVLLRVLTLLAWRVFPLPLSQVQWTTKLRRPYAWQNSRASRARVG
eukprot:COSAG06_NODE_3581_length_5158_cov_1.957304_2_plen_91_part_00